MSAANEFHIKSYVATAVALDAYVLVKKSGENVELVAAVTDVPIGITMAPCAASEAVPVRLLNGFGTALLKAGAAVTQNAVVRMLASGKGDDASAGAVIGTAEYAATADGDIIEVALKGLAPQAMTASADQAVATDLATVIALSTQLRTAAIAAGHIKGAA